MIELLPKIKRKIRSVPKGSAPRKIELVGAMKQLRIYAQRDIVSQQLAEEARKGIIEKTGQSSADLEKRVGGLRAEDEFKLMSLLLGNAEQITPLEQKQFVNWDRYTIPDFLMSVRVPKQLFGNEKPLIQRFFVDVKSRSGDGLRTFLLPVETFEKLVKFSALYHPIPLYFALRMGEAGSATWYLISAAALAKISKTSQANIRRRKEDCLSSEVVDILKEDTSGMWLSNYSIMAPTGTQIVTTYSKSGDGPVFNEKYGRIVRLEAQGPGGKVTIKFEKPMGIENLLLQEVIRRFEVGQTTVVPTTDGTEVRCVCDVNYSVPFYWVVLDTYLDMREKFEPAFSKTPVKNPTIDYFIESFSDFDRNLAISIRNAIWKLAADRLIVPIKMVPGRYYGESQDPA